MGAKLRGDTTVGPYCKVGVEVSASVLFAYSKIFIAYLYCGVYCVLAGTFTVGLPLYLCLYRP